MQRRDIEISCHNHPENGLYDNTAVLLQGDEVMTDQQLVFRQESTSNRILFGREFQRGILNRVQICGCQKLSFKLRLLNKRGKERVEKGIKEVKINLLNIQDLAKSHFSGCIKTFHVFARGDDVEELRNLSFLSPKYFPSNERIKVAISGQYSEMDVFHLPIEEPLVFQNLILFNKSKLEMLQIEGKLDVTIQNCTFNRLGVGCSKNALVTVQNSSFLNARESGIWCRQCQPLDMDQVQIMNCGAGCSISRCGYVNITNIQAVSCEVCGIFFYMTRPFSLHNVSVQDCGRDGIMFSYCYQHGAISNAYIQGCRGHGICVRQSKVSYAQIQYENNQEQDIFVRFDSEFSQKSLHEIEQFREWLKEIKKKFATQ